MKILNWRTLLGIGLLLLGAVALLQQLNVFGPQSSLPGLLFAALFAFGGIVFLGVLIADRSQWWAVIPGLTLLSLGVLIALGELAPSLARFGGTIFLAGLGLSFCLVYLLARGNWWAIIPGGTLLTLAVVAGVPESGGLQIGGVFFLGLALTFAILGLIRVGDEHMRWPWIPAGILALIGVGVAISSEGWVNYLWPVALIVFGGYLVVRAVRK